jgi:hypothetical protein
MRSMYMLSEYDNVKAGRPVQHPNQFQQGAGRLIFLWACGLFLLPDLHCNLLSFRLTLPTLSGHP